MSRLSMPTLRRLVATEPMSFSESQDLKSFTAKLAETPEQMDESLSQLLQTDLPGSNPGPNNTQINTHTPQDTFTQDFSGSTHKKTNK